MMLAAMRHACGAPARLLQCQRGFRLRGTAPSSSCTLSVHPTERSGGAVHGRGPGRTAAFSAAAASSVAAGDAKRRATAAQAALHLERLDVDLFRATDMWAPPGAKGVFGGQILGQAVKAAHETVATTEMQMHSVHGYFLLPGDSSLPALLRVRRLRDGRTMSTRAVDVRQNGRTIFSCVVSFQRDMFADRNVIEHADIMPDVPPPESLPSAHDTLRSFLKDPRLHDRFVPLVQASLEQPFPVDVRNVTPGVDPFEPKPLPARHLTWMRVDPEAGLSGDPNLHNCFAAFMSDWQLCLTPLLPAAKHLSDPQLALVTSLDHAMWFNAPFRADEWMLYEMWSPMAGAGRGLTYGKLFRRDGTLAVSVAQECLIRLKPPKGEDKK